MIYRLAVEGRIVLALLLREGDCGAGMLIEEACNHILNVVAPYCALRLDLLGVFFDELQYREHVVLRIFEEAEQEFHCTVARAATHCAVGGVEPINAVADCLDGVGKGKLLIVVGVDAEDFAVLLRAGLVKSRKPLNLF